MAETKEETVTMSEEEARVPVPGRFHKVVVRYPVAVMSVTGALAITLAVLAFAAGESELGGSFTDTSNLKVRRLYGFYAFRQDYWEARAWACRRR